MALQKEKRPQSGRADAAKRLQPPMESLHLSAALQYAAHGMCIFPVHTVSLAGTCSCEKGATCGQGGKHPRIGQWQVKATADEATVRQWWTHWPEANIGLHVGKSGIVVIDIDPRNGGDVTFEGLEQQHGKVSAMAETITGGNGRHLFFEAPDNISLPTGMGVGIDLQRGDKYVILPPSRHKSGRPYVWRAGCDLPSNAAMLTYLPAWVAEGVARSLAATVGAGAVDDDVDDWAIGAYAEIQNGDLVENLPRVKAMLPFIDPNSRENWRNTTWALHGMSNGSEDGYDLSSEWAQGYPHYKEAEHRALWDAETRKRRTNGVNPLGMGTLVHLAKEGGWVEPPKQEVTSEGHSLKDVGGAIDLGHRFAEMYRDKFLCVYDTKTWLRWTDVRWARCSLGEERQAAELVIEQMVQVAMRRYASKPKSEAAKLAFQQAMKMRRASWSVSATLDHAATVRGMNVSSVNEFDRNPELLGTRNGVVNLRTGQLMPAMPEQRISRQAEASFVVEATCPKWLRFLDQICDGDVEVTAFLQRFFGYMLTGHVSEEKLLYVWGPGGNGKSVLANVVSAIMGDYAGTVSHELLVKKLNNGEARHTLNRLCGLRLALMNEVPKGATFDGQRMKEVTSHDKIAARANYGDAYDFSPTHKLMLRGNYHLTVHDTDDGFWDRILLLELTGRFRGVSGEVRDLHSVLIDSERDGILMWMIDGAKAYLRERDLRIPKVIRDAVLSYRTASDVISQWLTEECVIDGAAEARFKDVYQSYEVWMAEAGMNRLSRPGFTREMVPGAHRLRRRESNGVTFLGGIRLRTLEEKQGADL